MIRKTKRTESMSYKLVGSPPMEKMTWMQYSPNCLSVGLVPGITSACKVLSCNQSCSIVALHMKADSLTGEVQWQVTKFVQFESQYKRYSNWRIVGQPCKHNEPWELIGVVGSFRTWYLYGNAWKTGFNALNAILVKLCIRRILLSSAHNSSMPCNQSCSIVASVQTILELGNGWTKVESKHDLNCVSKIL